MTRLKLLDKLEQSDNWVVKLMPHHDKCADKDGVGRNPLLTLLKHADRVVCLLRKDLNSQVISYWITKMCGQLQTNHNIEAPGWHDQFKTEFDFNDFSKVKYTYVHKGDVITVEYPWCEVVAKSLPMYRKFLFDEIRWIKKACKDIEVETVYTEDISTGSRYQRPFVLPKSFPMLATGYTLDRLTVAE